MAGAGELGNVVTRKGVVLPLPVLGIWRFVAWGGWFFFFFKESSADREDEVERSGQEAKGADMQASATSNSLDLMLEVKCSRGADASKRSFVYLLDEPIIYLFIYFFNLHICRTR